LSGESFGFSEREVYVNSTFGPLKFDTDKNIVVHLMIYDLEGHRDHVIKSPFTCYDWERSDMNRGASLKDLYPVQKLQPGDFSGVRRGIQNYLDDLDRGSISYRKYSFDHGVEEVTLDHQLDSRHQGEYAFHIVKNLVINYCKLMEQKNLFLTDDELIKKWEKYLPHCDQFISFYKEISVIKLKRELEFPQHTVGQVKSFIEAFSKQLSQDWEGALVLDWVRHGKTEFNDGSFLGQGRDPGLLESPKQSDAVYDSVYCSPLKRAQETATGLSPDCSANLMTDLLEINYGKVEGMKYDQLLKSFPEFPQKWSEGLDPRFPDGESTQDVLDRLQNFFDQIKNQTGKVLVVSHNVVMRCMLGLLYELDQTKWFKIPVQHLDPFRVKCLKGRFYLNLSREQKTKIMDSMVSWLK
jgi:alpha-ribazole phosphatase